MITISNKDISLIIAALEDYSSLDKRGGCDLKTYNLKRRAYMMVRKIKSKIENDKNNERRTNTKDISQH